MGGWQTHTGTAVALPVDGIDTDQLIPARFMATPRSEGYGRFLLHDLRFDEAGQANSSFALNQVVDASVIVTGRNFGSGSSREAAVYALVDFGIRVVIAPSFGDIFAGNAVNNGLLPAQVTPDAADQLFAQLKEGVQSLTVSLESCDISVGSTRIPFTIDPVWRTKLIEGWDDIDLTASHAGAISAFSDRDRVTRPWAYLDRFQEGAH